jgi:D-alanyl-D-alanine carboxypeptidase
MATTVNEAKISGKIVVSERLSKTGLTVGGATDYIDVINQIIEEQTLSSGSSVDAEVVYMGTITLSDGSATVDLKALENSEGDTIVTEGKNVRAIMARATATNTGAFSLADGASNGYQMFGNTFLIALNDSNWFLSYLGADAPAISDTSKTIDCAGTGSESCKVIIIFG